MKAMRKFVWLGLPVLLTAASAPAFAQSNDEDRGEAAIATAQADPPSSSEAKRDPAVYVQHRLARLKSKLGITADQEPQWSAFTGTVMQQRDQFRTKHQAGRTSAQTAPERIDRRIEWMKERTAAFEAVGQAAKSLYAALTPDQQKIADQRLLRWHAHRPS